MFSRPSRSSAVSSSSFCSGRDVWRSAASCSRLRARAAPTRSACRAWRIAELAAAHAAGVELAHQPELDQLAHRMRQHVDAHAERLQLGDALDHSTGTPPVQAERSRKPADACPAMSTVMTKPLHSLASWHRRAAVGNCEEQCRTMDLGGPQPLISSFPMRSDMLKLYYATGTCALATYMTLEEAGADYTRRTARLQGESAEQPGLSRDHRRAACRPW